MKRINITISKDNDDKSNVSIENSKSDKSIFDQVVEPQTLCDKYDAEEPFTKADLISLYDIYNVRKLSPLPYLSSAYVKIPLIKSSRNVYDDMATIFDCDKEQIAIIANDLHKDPSRYVVLLRGYFGDIADIPIYSKLRYIGGDCNLQQKNIEGKFPVLESISGNAIFDFLEKSTGLERLKSIGNAASFKWLKEATGLCNLELIGSSAIFSNLMDATGLDNLKYICGKSPTNDAYFNKLTTSKGLDNLKKIFGNASFPNLLEATHLTSLESIYGSVKFNALKSSIGLEKLLLLGSYAEFDELSDISGLSNLAYLDFEKSSFPNLSSCDRDKIKSKVRKYGA